MNEITSHYKQIKQIRGHDLRVIYEKNSFISVGTKHNGCFDSMNQQKHLRRNAHTRASCKNTKAIHRTQTKLIEHDMMKQSKANSCSSPNLLSIDNIKMRSSKDK